VCHNTASMAVGFAYNHWVSFSHLFLFFFHIKMEMERIQVEFFHPVWFFWLLDLWSILCAQPQSTVFKTLGVIHERYTRPDTRPHVRPEPIVAIHRFFSKRICVKMPKMLWWLSGWSWISLAIAIRPDQGSDYKKGRRGRFDKSFTLPCNCKLSCSALKCRPNGGSFARNTILLIEEVRNAPRLV
jgi:hypothetical protein